MKGLAQLLLDLWIMPFLSIFKNSVLAENSLSESSLSESSRRNLAVTGRHWPPYCLNQVLHTVFHGW
jgi:hypothetical protein